MESSVNYNTLYSFVRRGGRKLSRKSLNSIARTLGVLPEELEGKSEVSRLVGADAELWLTIGDIIGDLEGEERDGMIRFINSFLEANADFIMSVYRKPKEEDL